MSISSETALKDGDNDTLPYGIEPGTVGTLQGSVSVGESGGVGWSTSLKVVTGVGGMQPSLSVGYSGGSYGALGVGFSLGGGDSSVSRCRQTLGRDDRHAPITWTIEDRLCLDGARLEAVSGEYGAPGTEYRIPTSPNLRIVGTGSSTDKVSGFEVHSPDGRVSYYGPNGEAMQWAQVNGEKVPFAWHLVRVVDRRTGNHMLYEYAGEPAEGEGQITPSDFRVVSIGYGLNSVASAPVSRRVVFEYKPVQNVISEIIQSDPLPNEPEAWIHQGYVSGQSYIRRQLLTRVAMEYLNEAQEWQRVRYYRLGYEIVPELDPVPLTWYFDPPLVPPTDENGEELPLPPPEVPVLDEPSTPDRVRLAALQECAPMNAAYRPCLWPTRFEWSSLSNEYAPMGGFGWDGAPFYPLPKIKDINTQPYLRIGAQVMADLDGDGDTDMLVMPEPMNAVAVPHVSWEYWETDADVHQGVATNLGAWSTQPWTNRAGTVVPSEGSVKVWTFDGDSDYPYPRPPEEVKVGHLKDVKASPIAWSVNYDGTGGTDVLMGEPLLELAGSTIDSPWGLGSKTSTDRRFASAANNLPESVCLGQIFYDDFSECNKDLLQSAADYTDHPGFMRDLVVVSLTQKASGANPVAQFKKTSLGYRDGRPILWAQPLDMNGDGLEDVMFCKADADYAAVAGQAMPMFYGPGGEFDPVNWVSGTMHYKLNEPGQGIDLSEGGVPAATNGVGSEPVLCHAKDTYLVMDLDGDGTQSLLHRVHPHVGQKQLSGIAQYAPEGMVKDPFPKDDKEDKDELTAYWPKLQEKVYAEHLLGEIYYSALTLHGEADMKYTPTTLPFEQFMVWHQNPGNTSRRYSTHQAASPTNVDGGMTSYDLRDGRLTDWGTPDAPMVGGPSQVRTGDINGDGLIDVLMVDFQSCYWGKVGETPADKPTFTTRTCSFQDVMEFGVELIEQTFEKLAVFTYLNRGDGSFELVQDGGLRLWDTDVTEQGEEVLNGIYTGKPGVNYDAIYAHAWTTATQASRGWKLEFASSIIGDGNGDGLADLGYIKTKFEPNGGWIVDSMAGIYRLYPVWHLGRHGGGLSTSETRMGLDLHKTVPQASGTGWPGWKPGFNLTRWGNVKESSAAVDVYEQQDRGLSARLMQLDVDKDGQPELAFYDHVRGTYWLVTPSATDEPQPHLLTAVADGLDARTEVDYAPQWTLTHPGSAYKAEDINLPYPFYRRPSTAPAAARLRQDTGRDIGNQPAYNTTMYQYGKTLMDVRRGISLGMDRSAQQQSIATPSGVLERLRTVRYSNDTTYSETYKAYPLAGSVLSETTLESGIGDDTARLNHTGHRYSIKAGKVAPTWRRQLESSTASTYEVGQDVPAGSDAALFLCLVEAYDGSTECALGNEASYQPINHSTTALAYDPDNYGLVKTQIIESAGTTAVTETQYEHRDPASLATPEAYLVGLPTTVWTAHEPQPGDGFTLRTSVSAYDALGRLASTTVEPDRPQYRVTTSQTYDDFGHIKTQTISADGIEDNTTTYGYSASGAYPTTVTNTLGHTATTRWYEGCGSPEQVTNALGHTQVNDIDTFCRDTGSQLFFGDVALSRRTRIQYFEWMPDADEGYDDKEIHVTTEVVGGAKSHTIANRVGQVLVNQAPAFGFETYTQTRYDDAGRVMEVSLPTKVGDQPLGWTTTTYDGQGRVIAVTKPDGTQQTTHYDRHVTTVTDEIGNSGSSETDALGQVIKVTPPADPEHPEQDLSMCYAYGAFGTLVEAGPCVPTPVKGVTLMAYDDYGRLVRSQDNQAGVRLTRYDALGRVEESEDALGQITRVAYDILGRKVSRTQSYGTPNAKTAVWAYDDLAPGVLTHAVNDEGTVIEQPLLDEYNRGIGLVTTIHGRSYTQRQSYDAWGRPASVSYPSLSLLAPVVSWTSYNDLDQPIKQSYGGQSLWEPIAADVWGLTEQQYGAGTLRVHTLRQPLTGRLEEAQTLRQVMVNSQPEKVTLEHFTYEWYDHGLIRMRTQKALTAQANDQADQFHYTPRGELRGWNTIGAGQAVKHGLMAYDGFGNITKSPSGTYIYENEQLKKINGPLGELSYAYDDNGRVISRTHPGGETQISYDPLNRVSQIESPTANQLMTYSADGAKVHVFDKVAGRETYYLGAYQEERGGELAAKGKIVGRYALGPAHLTRTWLESDLSFEDVLSYTPPADHLGSTTLVTDANGMPTDRRSYDTWGNERESEDWTAFKAAPVDDVQTPATGYTGHHERKQFGAVAPGISGLIDMQARYYDPTAMRFLQPDTIIPNMFSPTDWNRLTYVSNSPVNFSDPTGHAQQAETAKNEKPDHRVNADGSSVLSGNRPDECLDGNCFKNSQNMAAEGPSGAEFGAILGGMRHVRKVLREAREARILEEKKRAAANEDCMACTSVTPPAHDAAELNRLYALYLKYHDICGSGGNGVGCVSGGEIRQIRHNSFADFVAWYYNEGGERQIYWKENPPVPMVGGAGTVKEVGKRVGFFGRLFGRGRNAAASTAGTQAASTTVVNLAAHVKTNGSTLKVIDGIKHIEVDGKTVGRLYDIQGKAILELDVQYRGIDGINGGMAILRSFASGIRKHEIVFSMGSNLDDAKAYAEWIGKHNFRTAGNRGGGMGLSPISPRVQSFHDAGNWTHYVVISIARD